MKTLLEWLEDNRCNLKDGVYRVGWPGVIVHDGVTLYQQEGYILITKEEYVLKNGSISLIQDTNRMKTASDYLKDGADLLSERGKQYDKTGQERSMEKIVRIFNDMTGQDLTTVQGWYFMQVLKDVRFFQNPETVHEDSLLDKISYAALLAEEALKNDE